MNAWPTVFSHYWMPFIDTEPGYNVFNNHYFGSPTGDAEQQADIMPDISSNVGNIIKFGIKGLIS